MRCALFATFIDIFNGNRLTRAAAALSYHDDDVLPVVIVLYTLLGNSYDKAMRIVAFAENLMARETVSYIRELSRLRCGEQQHGNDDSSGLRCLSPPRPRRSASMQLR